MNKNNHTVVTLKKLLKSERQTNDLLKKELAEVKSTVDQLEFQIRQLLTKGDVDSN